MNQIRCSVIRNNELTVIIVIESFPSNYRVRYEVRHNPEGVFGSFWIRLAFLLWFAFGMRLVALGHFRLGLPLGHVVHLILGHLGFALRGRSFRFGKHVSDLP